MEQLPEITGLPRGARFVRADLHIHSVAGSHDVKDASATPDAIVATAAQEGLKIIAIADHNEIDGVPSALTASEAADILVVPAVELSTPEGHLLCYLPTYETLQRFHAQLDIVDRGTPNSRCRNAMLDCLNKLQHLGGFAILAHVDASAGFEVAVAGSSPHKADIICHRALIGIELKSARSTVSYSVSRSHTARMLPRHALSAGRFARLCATRDFRHGLLGPPSATRTMIRTLSASVSARTGTPVSILARINASHGF